VDKSYLHGLVVLEASRLLSVETMHLHNVQHIEPQACSILQAESLDQRTNMALV